MSLEIENIKLTPTGLKIIEAAKQLFAEEGFDAISTKQIAEKADVNEVSIFRIFKNKENLLKTVIIKCHLQPQFELITNLSDQNLEHILREVINIFHHFFLENIQIIKMNFRSKEGNLVKKLQEEYPGRICNFLAQVFQRKKKLDPKDANNEAVCFFVQIRGIMVSCYLLEDIAKKKYLNEYFEIIINKYK